MTILTAILEVLTKASGKISSNVSPFTSLSLNILVFPLSSASVVKSEDVGRNELCPCGSGKKYKKCCGQ